MATDSNKYEILRDVMHTDPDMESNFLELLFRAIKHPGDDHDEIHHITNNYEDWERSDIYEVFATSYHGPKASNLYEIFLNCYDPATESLRVLNATADTDKTLIEASDTITNGLLLTDTKEQDRINVTRLASAGTDGYLDITGTDVPIHVKLDMDIRSTDPTVNFVCSVDFMTTKADGTVTKYTGGAAQDIAVDAGAYTKVETTASTIGATFGFNSTASNVTGVKLNDTGAMTSLANSFRELSAMVTFECNADLSLITNFENSWLGCTVLASFPMVDTSAVTNFNSAWQQCPALTAFPKVDTSAGTTMNHTWHSDTGLTSFPLLDTSSVITFHETWHECSALTAFPKIDTSSGTSFPSTWKQCSSLTEFPVLDMSSAGDIRGTWGDCTSLETFPLLDLSSSTDCSAAWGSCTSLRSFPAMIMTGCSNFSYAWSNCSSLVYFQHVDFSAATKLPHAWNVCVNLECMSSLDFSSLLDGANTFKGCAKLGSPGKTGTNVRHNDNGTKGTWSNRACHESITVHGF